MSIESAIKAIHAAGLSDTQSEQFLSNDHLRRIVEVVLSEQWEPIETAPKDGTSILLDHPAWGKRALRGAWDETWKAFSVHGFGCPPTQPSHWHQLPNPPETKA